jgi:hypothetical protein
MPNGWRFRAGFRGVLVLQRHVGEWRDATTEDLVYFIAENGKRLAS